jgi:hypothetical protein
VTEDILLDEDGKVISTSKGGPSLFLKKALAAESIPFEPHEGDPLTVEILVTPDGEFGRIPQVPQQALIQLELMGEWTVVSTVLGEWQFPGGITLQGRVFVDLQGFVRDGKNFGAKKMWDVDPKLAEQIFCLKGTAEEARYIPEEVLEDQKRRLLIITRGKDGLDVFFKGEHREFGIEEVQDLKDTIGAGDTFLGYFVASMFKGNEPFEAAQRATQRTADFLREKREP